MSRRRLIACLLLGLLGANASGAALAHHRDCCPNPHKQATDCRTCYLLMVGRTAVAETPSLVLISDDFCCDAPPVARLVARVADHHPPASPRAPPLA